MIYFKIFLFINSSRKQNIIIPNAIRTPVLFSEYCWVKRVIKANAHSIAENKCMNLLEFKRLCFLNPI